jgi:uncharacterized protein
MQRKSNIKIIIDTNIWISFLIGKKLKSLKDLIIDKRVQLIFTEQLIEEIELVTNRKNLLKYFDKSKVIELIQLIRTIAEFHEIDNLVDVCRDPKDNFLLSLAAKSNSDFLITSDFDLLVLEKYLSTKIVNIKQFESEFNSK